MSWALDEFFARVEEEFGVVNGDAKFFLDARKELVERPAHENHSSGRAPPRARSRLVTDGLEYNSDDEYFD